MNYLNFLPLVVWGTVLINQYHLVTSDEDALDVFIPPKTGCNVNWIVQPTEKCSWCEGLFGDLMKGLTGSYNPSILNTMPEDDSSVARKEDLKGSCFINWVLTNDYGKLRDLFGLGSVAGVGFRSNDWFFFVNRAQEKLFMTWFQGAVDADFGNRYPRTVVVLLDPEGMLIPLTFSDAGRSDAKKALSTEISLLWPCLLCPTESSAFVWNDIGSKNPWDVLEYAVSTQGYGSATTTPFGDPFYDGNIPIDGAFQDLDRIYFESWRPVPAKDEQGVSYIIGAASKHLNFSGTIRKAYIKRPSLITCFDCNSPPAFSKVDSIVFSTADTSFVYCRSKSSTKTDAFSALLLPFDDHTWGFLILSLSMIWPVFGFRNVLVLVGSLLAQGINLKTFRWLVAALVILLIVLQVVYVTFYTSNAVIPFEEPPIRSNQELFDMGFKIVAFYDIELSEFAELYTQYFKDSLDKVKLDTNHLEQYFVSLKNVESMDAHEQIIATRNFGTTPFGRILKSIIITLLAENGTRDTRCHMLEESWETVTTRMYFTGHLMEMFRTTFNHLLSAGLGEFWKAASTSTQYRRSKKLVSDIASTTNEEITTMNSAIRSVTKAYFLLLLAYLVFFVFEAYLWSKIMALWQGLQLKNKIWSKCSITLAYGTVGWTIDRFDLWISRMIWPRTLPSPSLPETEDVDRIPATRNLGPILSITE